MTMHAYPETYLDNAQATLGEAFDFAVCDCGIKGDDFVKLFVVSNVSKRIENGEPSAIVGKSGIELVHDIVMETKGCELRKEPSEKFGRSPEYWIGWAVAYYQWLSGRHFGEIFSTVTFEELMEMYYTLHEADITKFADTMDMLIKKRFPETNLKRIRTICGYTQSKLARLSGVGLRSIQMYEQRNKDINKAGVASVYNISRALGCRIEDLIER